MSSSTTSSQDLSHQTWTRGEYFISTDKSLLSISSIYAAFESDFMYWTNRLPDSVLQTIIDKSMCFGLYTTFPTTLLHSSTTSSSFPDSPSSSTQPEEQKPAQIGLARLVTDDCTFAYLTDLYVLPAYQGTGLGGWLLDCVDECLDAMPHLRWTLLRTSNATSKEAYKKRLGMMELVNGATGPWMMGKKGRGNMA